MMNLSSYFRRILSCTLILVVFASLIGTSQAVLAGGVQSFIVQGADVDQLVRLVEYYGGSVTSRLDIIQGVGADLPVSTVAALRSEKAVSAVTANVEVHLADMVNGGANYIPSTDYPEVVGADLVWDNSNLGDGVTVAIVDTGLGWHPGVFMDVNHKLRDRVVAWVDFVQHKRLPFDPNGHGTHIAGIIANSQKDSSGGYNGVAPDVNLVGVRVLDRYGGGTYEKVIQGIQWVIEHKDQYNIRVLNLSLVSPAQSPYWADPLDQAVMQAWAEDIVVVTAAGNGGPDPMTIGVPGNTPYVITVGAFTDNYTPMDWSDDYITPFSAAGPTLDGFVKPDVVAPGAHMVSAMLPSAQLARDHGANKITPFYFSMAGTSQATAVVSGIAALMLAENPDLTPNEVKYRVMATSFVWLDLETNEALYSMWQQGFGRVNAYDAVMADEIIGVANAGMDIDADLAGTTHYEGFTVFDEETGMFHLLGNYGSWAGGYGSWAGNYGSWAGGYGSWAGNYGSWAGGYGSWAGGYGSWAGGYGIWAGGYGIWAGGYGCWAGGYGTWASGYGTWASTIPWLGTILSDASFVEDFVNGVSPDSNSTSATVEWVDEP